MGRTRLYYKNQAKYRNLYPYKMLLWTEYNYDELSDILAFKKSGPNNGGNTYNDIYIMADTETSKKRPDSKLEKVNKMGYKQITYIGSDNHVCAWSIALRAYDTNIVTLFGHKPSDMITCIEKLHKAMPGDRTIIYFHNWSYDYLFLRKFMFIKWGTPKSVLNVKPHYPIYTTFENGIMIKDSLILAQRNLQKWADDLEVEHRKAVGCWDYNVIRHQSGTLSEDELKYIECDVVAGVECLNATADALKKRVYTLPYTATGIPREIVRKRGKEVHAHDYFLRIAPDYQLYCLQEQIYHGGFTHSNRHFIGQIVETTCYDLSSSYPYQLLTMKAPCESFTKMGKDVHIHYILKHSDKYGFLFKLTLYKFRLKDKYFGMPPLQLSKTIKTLNAVVDNGRIIAGDLAIIYLNEVDLKLIDEYYIYEKHLCSDVYYAMKDYLPTWFTNFVYECYKDKTMLKGGDPVQYAIAKAKLNSLYGMCVMKNIKVPIEEDYASGEYSEKEDIDPEELYNKYVNNHNTVLPYIWGVYCTSEAMLRLFRLGQCTAEDGYWVYSDTDSVYSTKFDEDKLKDFNDEAIATVRSRGYEAVTFKGKDYYMGVAEFDGHHPTFVTVGSKRYCCTDDDGKLSITVAGVPKKKGAQCLNSIEDFRSGFVFDGTITGKKLHTYMYVDAIYTDSNGNETGDSCNLSPCDYLLDSVHDVDIDKLFEEEIFIQVYDDDESDLPI